MHRKRYALHRFVLYALIASAAVSPPLFAAAAKPATQTELYAELYSAYKGAYYPGVVLYAEELESKFPKSILLPEARVYAGESLFHLGRLDEAEKELLKAAGSLSDSGKKEKQLKGAAVYWLGRTAYAKENFAQAAVLFSKSGTLLFQEQGSAVYSDNNLYVSSLLYGARSCMKTGDAAYVRSAVSVLEYLWGISLPAPLFYETAEMLFAAYRQCGLNGELICAFARLSRQSVPSYLYDMLALDAAEAFSNTGEFSKAYDIYADIVKNGSLSAAAAALQYAWQLPPSAGESPAEVQSARAALLEDASERGSSAVNEYPLLLAEFRMKLGIEEFRQKKYRDAEANFMLSMENLADGSVSAGGASADKNRFLYAVNVLYLTEIHFRLNLAKSPQSGAVTSAAAAYGELSRLQASGTAMAAAVQANLCRYASLAGRWKDARTHGKAALDSLSGAGQDTVFFDPAQTAYWYALAEMQTGNSSAAAQLLETYTLKGTEIAAAGKPAASAQVYAEQDLLPAAYLLYAGALFRGGRTKQALSVYEKLNAAGMLGSEGLLDYAKAALHSGMNALAYDLASRVHNLPEAPYIAALASFNRGDWQTADTMFSVYLSESKQPDPYALFYQGYAQYRLGQSQKAYVSLTEFTKKNPSHRLSLTADRIAATCAMQLHQQIGTSDTDWIRKAVLLAESIVKRSNSDTDRDSAVLFAVDVYDDARLYDKALDLMRPYITQQNSFGMNCRYRSAQLLAKKKQYEAADGLFAEIERLFPKDPLAEDASYRRGELYYTAEDYTAAAARFSSYRRMYPHGKYTDAAFYFGAECFARAGQPDQAILQYESLLSSYPASPFAYSALSALVTLYREKGEYAAALKSAQMLLSRYGDQVQKAALDRQIAELTLLASGASEKIAVKQVEFDKAGKTSTPAGRKAAVELAELYLAVPESAQEGAALLEKVYTIIKKPVSGGQLFPERETAAKCAYLLASWYRSGGKYADAAQYFLTAAEYYAPSDSELAARSLYGAAESFDSARQYADARSTAETLVKSFPNSVWASRAAAFRE